MKSFNQVLPVQAPLFQKEHKNYLSKFGRVNTKEEKHFQKLGAKIKQLREEKGMDQKSFPFEAGIGRTQLHRIENGKTNPRLLTLMKIAGGLEVSVSELLDF